MLLRLAGLVLQQVLTTRNRPPATIALVIRE
jgi:hypothetical protein